MRNQRAATVHDVAHTADRLAKDVLALAEIGGMPDDYWQTDRRIGRACKWLGWTREEAKKWARRYQR